MKLEGEHIFKGLRQEVWDMFMDPDVLASALPGAQKMEKVSDTEYQVAMNVRIGPVSGQFSGKLLLENVNEPESCTLNVDGKGAPGFAKGLGNVKFTEQGDGTTLMNYDGDMQIGGTLASVGQRMIDSVAKSMIRSGFETLDKALEARIQAKATGSEAKYETRTETEFAASVAKDMMGNMTKTDEGRMILYVVPALVILIALALILSRFAG